MPFPTLCWIRSYSSHNPLIECTQRSSGEDSNLVSLWICGMRTWNGLPGGPKWRDLAVARSRKTRKTRANPVIWMVERAKCWCHGELKLAKCANDPKNCRSNANWSIDNGPANQALFRTDDWSPWSMGSLAMVWGDAMARVLTMPPDASPVLLSICAYLHNLAASLQRYQISNAMCSFQWSLSTFLI